MKIVVLAGGLSPERNVSLSSGYKIASALRENGNEVILADLYTGEILDSAPCLIEEKEPDLEKLKEETGLGDILIHPDILSLCQSCDLVFLALHGAIGENGKLQAYLDLHGIPYTGSSSVGCMLSMDKDIAKQLMTENGIRTPRWKTYAVDTDLSVILKAFSYPFVIKPVSNGSSIGVSMVHSADDFWSAVHKVRIYEDQMIIEEMIEGREVSVGILDGYALPVIEILPINGFYNYQNKYQQGMTNEICPALISPLLTADIQKTALKVHQALRLGYYSRIDFLINEKGDFYCLEANSLPGMTPVSLLPLEAAVAGISYASLCEQIAQNAVSSRLTSALLV
ncbi:MAG: D-alanine--D-alanine ligase [Lachnospiraceae bacterium]|nr:D-alanine--D-alanine ligase [Lachnospiraceae bacterium]